MRTLVLGGTRSGKSAYGESLLDSAAPVRYVATLIAGQDGADPEMAERIRRHQQRRPANWQVVLVVLMINVILFAGVVPFVLWMLVCWAIRGEK